MTTTDIAVRATALPSAQEMQASIAYAEHLAASGLLPDSYRRQPANVLWAIEYGRTLSLAPMAAITGVHVIKGKPTASAALISALVRRAGHKLRVRGNDQRAEAVIIRDDDPEFEYRVEWTLERAVTANLCRLKDGRPFARDSKGEPTAWEKYPAAMLKARAITEVARDACEEVLFGLHYTPEELGAEVDEEGLPVAPVQRSQPSADDPWAVAEPAGPRPVTDQQRRDIAGLLRDRRGLTDPTACLAVISELAGRQVAGTTELTFDEAEAVGRALAAEAVPGDEVVDAEVVDDPAPAGAALEEPAPTPERPKGDMTDAQSRMLHAMLKGWTREEKLAAFEAILGRPVATSDELSKVDASRVIDGLKKSAEQIRERVRQGAQLPDDSAEQLYADLLAGIDGAANGQQLADVHSRASSALNSGALSAELFAQFDLLYQAVQERMADEAAEAAVQDVLGVPGGWASQGVRRLAGAGAGVHP